MKKSPEGIDQIAAALAAAQGAMTNPKKDRGAGGEGKGGGGGKSWRYATLDALIDAARSALSANGIGFTQAPEVNADGQIVVTTILMHSSGQWLETEIPVILGREFNVQQMGSAITYAKRYAFGATVGLTADEDDDGAAAMDTGAGSYVRDRVANATRDALRQGAQGGQGRRQADARPNPGPAASPPPPQAQRPQEAEGDGADTGRHFILTFPPDTFTGRVVERKFKANGAGARDFLTNLIRGLGTNRKLIEIQENRDAVQAIRGWAATDPERSWAIDLITDAETLAATPMEVGQ